MSRFVICAALIVVAGCATQRTQLEIVGPYANQLSQADIHQITALIVESAMYDHCKTTLEAIRPDKVVVNYIGYERTIDRVYTSGFGSTYFAAVKRNGRWIEEGLLDRNSRVTRH
jgi:hypothetical protein